MRKAYMDKFPCDWTHDDWRECLKDAIQKMEHASIVAVDKGLTRLEYFADGKAQAYKDVFLHMFPHENWED